MTVYVDDMWKTQMGAFGRMKMSHMAADTSDELLAMADTIGVARRWIQNPGESGEHFDIALGKRKLAVAAGAVEISMREMSMWLTERRAPGTTCYHSPPCAPDACPVRHDPPRPVSDPHRGTECDGCGSTLETGSFGFVVVCPVASWWPPQ